MRIATWAHFSIIFFNHLVMLLEKLSSIHQCSSISEYVVFFTCPNGRINWMLLFYPLALLSDIEYYLDLAENVFNWEDSCSLWSLIGVATPTLLFTYLG